MSSFRGYGEASGGDGGKKKKIAIISVASVVLLAMVVAVSVGVSKNHGSGGDSGSAEDISPSYKAITAICQPTDYKEACVTQLNAAAGSNASTDPKDLVKLAFKVTVDQIHKVLNQSALLQEAEKDSRTKQALDSCGELMDSSIADLEKSIEQMGNIDLSDIDDLLENLKTWLSATVANQETCLDGFQNTTGDVGEKMRSLMKTAGQLSSNTLAIVDEISSILTNLNIPFLTKNRRRLLSDDGLPSWVSPAKRRLLEDPTSSIKPDVVVAKDGSGQFKTISDALVSVPKRQNTTYVVYVKEGVYEELVQINRTMTNLMLMGDGPTKTKITGNLNFIDGTPTFKTATVVVVGDGFMARDIGFENSAGAAKHQAVALRVGADMSIFYNCQMDGYQDTLYAHTKRQFYRDCTISGTIDFIFGDSISIFQNCKLVVRKPMENQQNICTAQGRKDKRESTLIVLHNCTFTAEPDYYPFKDQLPTYLGRPWKEYSRTIIMQSWMDDIVQPAGWKEWMGDFGLSTLFYAEFDNRGPGSKLDGRVKWAGVRTLTAADAAAYAPDAIFQDNEWIKKSGVPYTGGLLPLASPDQQLPAAPAESPN
ncbi:putative pectinesterase/pectinesterase inhibitor 28 [Nymphaea colorata]|nr:putative pectinesterase/pectinesterase inhibitor 28 [Nymphaea colorata]